MQRVEPQRRQFENMPAFLEDEGQSRSMDNRSIAASVLKSVGGKANVVANSLCMTRLRLTIADPTLVDRKALASIPGVLGTVGRGANGLEVVFGPTAVRGVFDTFAKLTGLAATYDLPQDKDLASNFNVQVTSGSADTGPDVDAPADPSAARAERPLVGAPRGPRGAWRTRQACSSACWRRANGASEGPPRPGSARFLDPRRATCASSPTKAHRACWS